MREAPRPIAAFFPLADCPTGTDRPLAAVGDFLIERPISSSHRLFAGAKMNFDRRRNQSFGCVPAKATIVWQL